ncbi:DUF4333 domain-containing protein [Svornostia abyssi]|uniref:DUF4333 domain-containing protein n=1 Tax=Svornostia abyssi TaxID=2898438 RepID=UPI00338DD8DB
MSPCAPSASSPRCRSPPPASPGCGTTTLDTDKAETEITKELDKQVGTGAKVSCPDDVEVKKGDTFNCTATDPEGNKATIVVTQKDDEGNITWELKK